MMEKCGLIPKINIAGKTLLAALAAGSVAMADGFEGFGGVRFVMPQIREDHLADPEAMELSDGRMFGRIRQVGVEVPSQTHAVIDDTKAWLGSVPMLRYAYSPEVVRDGKVAFKLGGVENPEKNLYDFADEGKRKEAAAALAKTAATATAEWVMFDEPIWGHRGMDKPDELPISDALKSLVQDRVGRPIRGVEDFENDPEVWHAFVYVRQRAIAESLKDFAEAVRGVDKRVSVNMFPAALESGASSGFEIATAMDVLGSTLDQVQIDPYYTLFVEDPRFSGFMLRLQDEVTPRDLPLLGWIDGVDGLAEELGIKLPPPESMKPQLAVHLAHGSDHLAVWSYGYMKGMGNLEPFLEMARWIRENQVLYRDNPAVLSDTGLYYSNATVAMHDFFPKAWSHGTGPYGQYFTALNTYYMGTATQVPLRVISTPLGHEDRLEDSLKGLRRLILPDAVVMTDAEVSLINDWVRDGGELIVIGQAGIMDEYRNPRDGGLPKIFGIGLGEVKPRREILFTEAWPEGDASMALNGSNEHVFIERYQENRRYALDAGRNRRAAYYTKRWPLHLREEVLGDTRALPDPQSADWDVQGAPGLLVGPEAEVLALFDDGDVAVAGIKAGKGTVIYVAPTDWLVRYREPKARELARTLFCRVSSPQFYLEGVDGEQDLATVEMVVTERREGTRRVLIPHLIRHIHDDQGIVPEGGPLGEHTLTLPLEPGEVVRFVKVFSPDERKPFSSHKQEGNQLRITFDRLDVYNAAMVAIEREGIN